MLAHELNLPDDPLKALSIAIPALRPLYRSDPGNWPRTLWRICRKALHSHYTETNGLGDLSGITKEHVIGLRRLSRQCGGWFDSDGRFIPMDQWLQTEGD